MVPGVHPIQHPEHLDRLVQPFLQGSRLWQTDRQTDRATSSVTVGFIYARSTAMRPNNNTNVIFQQDHSLCGSSHMFIWWMHNADSAPDGCSLRPTKPTCTVSPHVGCYRPHPPPPFIIITQPESWYSFCHLTFLYRILLYWLTVLCIAIAGLKHLYTVSTKKRPP